LALTCPNCGAEQPVGARFCNNCGHQLDAPAAATPLSQAARPGIAGGSGDLERFIPRELLRKLESARAAGQMVGERRVVTMLFCDVKGSTAAAARFDPEEWAEIINGAFAHMIAPIYRYEGTVARLMGDGLLAFFGAPIAHEDDPERAALAGLEIVEGIRAYGEEMRRAWGIEMTVRVGVNTGLVVVGAVGSDLRMEYSALGEAINLAARMEQTAPPGVVQIAEPTYRLVAPLFDVEAVEGLALKGVAEPVRAYRVRGRRAAPGSLRGIAGLASPLIGRAAELEQVTAALRQLNEGRGGIAGVIGEAGLGKSRLIAEALAADSAIRRLEGKPQSYETTVPYAPFTGVLAQSANLTTEMDGAAQYATLREQVERLLPGRSDELTPFLAQPLGLPIPAMDEERVRFLEPPILRGRVFAAVGEWLAALAAERPTVLYLDDIHWIDPTSLEMLKALLPIVERVPLLILLAFRPRQDDPSWQFHGTLLNNHADRYRAIFLRPLDESQGHELIANLLIIEELPETVRRLILEKAEGNPFFLEEIIRSLLDAKLIERQNGHWRATAAIVKVRIPDTLVGVITARLDRLDDADKQVIQAAAVLGREFSLENLAELLEKPNALRGSLATLQRRELIRQTSPGGFSFKHGMTQEAAYESLLLSRRRQLHHRAADVLLKLQPDHAADIARHYLEARQPAQALPHLVAAGGQAARAFAVQEAIGYFAQALAHEEVGNTPLIRSAYEGLGGMMAMGDPLQAVEVFNRMLAAAETRGDTAMKISALNKLGSVSALMMGRFDMAEEYLDRAERLATPDTDADGFAELSIIRCQMCTMQADFDSVVNYMDGVVRSSLQTGNNYNLALGLGHTTNSLMFLNRFEDAWLKAHETLTLARQIGDRAHEAEMLSFAIPLIQLRNGDPEAALTSAREGVAIANRIGALNIIGDGEWLTAEIHRARGDYEEALAAGQRSLAAARPLESFLPFYAVHSLSTLGSIYLEISERFTDKIAEFHRYALGLLETPTGAIGGGSAWADLGWCALTLGDTELADELFGKGLNHPTMMMKMERPRHLAGAAAVHLARGERVEALRLAEEALAYAEEHRMNHHYPLARLVLGRALAADDRHEAALSVFEQCASTSRELGFRPILWQALAAAARSLDALGQFAEAAAAANEAAAVTDTIAAHFSDAELRAEYRQSIARRLARLAGSEPPPATSK
jgi:class 3 adenylate cyclase/tetratricopeptide (TPR) repeat protein